MTSPCLKGSLVSDHAEITHISLSATSDKYGYIHCAGIVMKDPHQSPSSTEVCDIVQHHVCGGVTGQCNECTAFRGQERTVVQ